MELFPQQIVALLLLAAGLVAVIHVVRTSRKVQEAQLWPSVKGLVNTSVVKRSGGRNRVYRAKIEYTYVVGGREHVGKRYALGGELDTSSRARAEERCARYPEGSEPDVYYDPANPSDACLVRAQEGVAFTILIGGVFAAVGVAMLLGFLPGT
jgi:hypothetical protein